MANDKFPPGPGIGLSDFSLLTALKPSGCIHRLTICIGTFFFKNIF